MMEERMARHKRIQTPGLVRHVMSRGNGRMPIFLDETDYRWFLYLLSETVETKDLECWNVCPMPNHYHLVVRPRQANFSEAIRLLNSGYAQWWNRRHAHVGHVFQGRLKDQIVQREGYLEALCRYVALNPVRAGLVALPEEWEWSSYGATIGMRPAPSFLAVSSVLSHFGNGTASNGLTRYVEYVLGNPVGECTDDRIRSNERILGDAEFKKSISAGRSGS